MDARIEIRRANSEPKCCNCGWWQGGTLSGVEYVTTAARCDRHDIKTLDLAVCGDWRDGDPVQDILIPEKDE